MNSKVEVTKEECFEKVQEMASWDGVQEQLNTIEADILRIFQQLKVVLDQDYKLSEVKHELGSVRAVLNQHHSNLDEIYDCL